MKFIVSLLAALSLVGCSVNPTTGQQELSGTGKAAIVAFTGEFVDRYLAESPDRAKSIANIRDVAVRLQNVTDAVTVSELRARLDVEVAKLDISDINKRSLKRWSPILEGLLQDYVGSGQLDANAYVRVNEFLNLIVAALPAV